MTRDGFHALLIAPSTGETLDRWLEEDERDRQRVIQENNERLVTAYILAWFRRTEAHE